MSQEDKVKENRLRRIAERRGLRLEKSRRRDQRAPDYNGFMLVDAYKNTVVLGATHFAYSASLEDVEAFLEERENGDVQKPAKQWTESAALREVARLDSENTPESVDK